MGLLSANGYGPLRGISQGLSPSLRVRKITTLRKMFNFLGFAFAVLLLSGNSKGQDGSESPPSLMKAHSKMYPSPWDEWWGYGGRAAPEYWGDTYPDHWYMCSRGKQQSPINIEPDLLLYDGNLGHLIFNSPPKVEGILQNTGNDITLTFKNDIRNQINVTGGPLSYVFRITDVKFHFGRKQRASEHQINNKSFTAEMHIIGYNSEVYSTIDQAMNGVRGLVAIAVFIEIGLESNDPLELITKRLKNIPMKGNKINISFNFNDLIPNTTEYMTYEGSLTIPGCQESVTWIIYNKPVYLSSDQMKLFQTIPQMRWIHTNSRSVMPLNQRVIRTNINVKQKTDICTIEQHFNYKVNEMFTS